MRDVPQNAIQKTKVAIIGSGPAGLLDRKSVV